MIKSIQIEVFVEENNFTALEEKLIELFIVNTGVFVNALNTAKPMAMNPIEQSDANFSLELLFQSSIEDEIGVKMAEDLKKRVDVMFDMAEIKLIEIKSVPVAV